MNNNSADKSASKKAGHLGSVANTTKDVVAVEANSIQKHEVQNQDGPLEAKEKTLLAECKTDISKNLQGWFVVGYRLWQIREQRLHRDDKGTTFEEFCNREWDFSKSHANRVIKAYLCANHLKNINDMKVCVPSHESQVRCIAGLPTEDQVKVAKEVFENVGEKRASAGDFLAAKDKFFPPKAKPAAGERKQTAPDTAAEPATFGTNLVPFSKLKEMADSAYMYCGTRNQDALKLIGKLQRHLDEWVDWQAKQPQIKEVV